MTEKPIKATTNYEITNFFFKIAWALNRLSHDQTVKCNNVIYCRNVKYCKEEETSISYIVLFFIICGNLYLNNKRINKTILKIIDGI
ncbi:hypothetical protein RCL_jg6303.t1 [Rhizophagus clarus]|uniref:Uncharacterized protein n=1 Tax=Rhizophagus clarus TaxID=94130 RepID=A0A8H3QHJ2_9GLOM|nr:hypothetical protein RCL_jg6303.t1 [Rhizophagus clarus]